METLRVLVVDDERGMRLSVARALRDFTVAIPEVDAEVSYEVDQAESGEQALRKIKAQLPDILLLDHMLPGMSGLDVLDQIGPQKLDLLTIMITAYASIETAVRATKRGSYDFLPKPFTPAELREALRKASKHLLLGRQARQLAQEKRQVRFQFISVLAHELKAPITAVEGYLLALKDHSAGDDPAVYEQMLERCLTRTEYMRKMIGDLLDLTRIESGQKTRQLAEVNLREAAQAAIDTAMPSAQPQGISFCLQVSGQGTMTADRGEIDIILNNLVSNAVKYNRDGGKVTVTVDDQDDFIRISVADTGIGMTPDESVKLFADFVRIKNDRTRHIFGSGLGLSIVKKLAELYGGEVTVTSQPDVGSTFTVTLRNPVSPH